MNLSKKLLNLHERKKGMKFSFSGVLNEALKANKTKNGAFDIEKGINDLIGTDFSASDEAKESKAIHKTIRAGYDALIKFEKKFKSELNESIDDKLLKKFVKELKDWKIEDRNGVVLATMEDDERLHTIKLHDESGNGEYYAMEHKESDLKGNNVNNNTFLKSSGVKPKFVIKELEKFLSKI